MFLKSLALLLTSEQGTTEKFPFLTVEITLYKKDFSIIFLKKNRSHCTTIYTQLQRKAMAQRSVGQKHAAGETGLLRAAGPQGGLLISARLSQRALYLRYKEPGHPNGDSFLKENS